MLRSKFWTGLKSQAIKNSTHHLTDSIKNFQTLLKEIRKVDQEGNSIKNSKQQTAQKQHNGQVTTDNTNAELLKQMKEFTGRMPKMEEKLEQKNRSDPAQSNFSPNHLYHVIMVEISVVVITEVHIVVVTVEAKIIIIHIIILIVKIKIKQVIGAMVTGIVVFWMVTVEAPAHAVNRDGRAQGDTSSLKNSFLCC